VIEYFTKRSLVCRVYCTKKKREPSTG